MKRSLIHAIPLLVFFAYPLSLCNAWFQSRNQNRAKQKTEMKLDNSMTIPNISSESSQRLSADARRLRQELNRFLPQPLTNVVIAYGEEGGEWFCAQKIESYRLKLESILTGYRWYHSRGWFIDKAGFSFDEVILKRNWGRMDLMVVRRQNKIYISLRKGCDEYRSVVITSNQFILFVFGIDCFSRHICEHSPHFSNLDERLIKDSFLERIYDDIIF
jgi:hypothetical protein